MVIINQELCIGCGLCAADCVAGNIKIGDKPEGKKAEVLKPCFSCGHCVAVCPKKAVSIPEYQMEEVEEYQKETFDLQPDNVLHAIKFRRSIREYQNRKIENATLNRIAAAGVYTETAVNSQGVRFIIVQEELDKLKEMAWEGWMAYADQSETPTYPSSEMIRTYNEIRKTHPEMDRLFFNAPAVVIVASEVPLDGGLAAANMEMMSVAEGLGMLFNGFLVRALNHNKEALKWLKVEDCPISAAMLLGYPAITYQRTAPRKHGNVWIR